MQLKLITQQKDRPVLCRIILILAVDNSLKLHIFEFSQFQPDLIAPINFGSMGDLSAKSAGFGSPGKHAFWQLTSGSSRVSGICHQSCQCFTMLRGGTPPWGVIFHENVNFLFVAKQGKSEGFDSCDRPSNLKLDSNHQFFRPCDPEIWWMTLQNKRAPLLCYFKLCASFRNHWCIETWVTVRKRPIWVKFDDF